jgi:hypothetical protein
MLGGVSVHRVFQKIGADAAVVEEGVALPGRAIANDALASAPGSNQELQ